MFQRRMTKKGRRDLTPEYKEWRDRAGWLLKMQLVGVPEITCRFNVSIEVPISRMDVDNHTKPLLDLCQNVHLISNDGNTNKIEIVPVDRPDCRLAFWPLPEMGSVRAPAKSARSYVGGRKPAKLSVKQAHQMGMWRP
jgi:Holliday junction resolvase RusA-like endonuclease